MTISTRIRQLVPSGVIDYLRARRARETAHNRRVDFYRLFLTPGDLTFDVGANVGERVAAMLEMGCRVVAVEPQASCCARLMKIPAPAGALVVVPKACGAVEGTAELKSSGDADVLASISDEYIATVSHSGRFAGHQWDASYTVEVCTLDTLMRIHGVPKYIKIDVEGSEEAVLSGLHDGPEIISFEYTPELAVAMQACIGHCERLGLRQFNISFGESMTFSRQEWISADRLRQIVEILEGDAVLFGDIFARRQKDKR